MLQRTIATAMEKEEGNVAWALTGTLKVDDILASASTRRLR
jgi:hypothetical protein